MQIDLKLPEKFQKFFTPQGDIRKTRYKVMHGGRGGAKSVGIAKILVLLARYPHLFGGEERLLILCAREFQASISDSVHSVIAEQIEELGLENDFTITDKAITCNVNGSKFAFKGLARNINSIKSFNGANICWIEEGDSITARSWNKLDPTIRKPGSEIWISYNPEDENDIIHQKFVVNVPPLDSLVIEINWRDNPWFPKELYDQMMQMRTTDYDGYMHTWEGQCVKNSHAQVFFEKWVVEEFTADAQLWDGPYFGADWGFSTDPTAGIEMWVDTANNNLMIEYEAVQKHLELNDTGQFFIDNLPNCEGNIIRGDCSRPETISYLVKTEPKLPRLVGCKKWTGCVEDGVSHLKSYNKIIIHPRCKTVIHEAKNYSYKLDKSENPTTVILDKDNHTWDAIRYGLEPHIKTQPFYGVL